ncbi:MAG: polysaccharide export protein [Aphanocapsa lilacina HA4352-LM1]|jgi:polysaccharide export outer membrane protein|nr:polysaccharide export protein [Aphanocapsa lilacina HA4352-LM1]
MQRACRNKRLSGIGWLALCSLAFAAQPAEATTLSTFDRVSVAVANGEEFGSAKDGTDPGFLIGADGSIHVPQLGRVPAAGREEIELQEELTERLRAFIRVPDVSVRVVSLSPASVEVTGAVYRPGQLTIRSAAGSEQGSTRTVYNAIKDAGGVRPDADVAAIALERAGKRIELPPGQDAPVIGGDRIIVASLGAGQSEASNLPTQLAPETITVYVSGQDLPAGSAGPVKLRPGTTLAGALTAAGGSGESFLRSGRKVTLIRTDPASAQRTAKSFEMAEVLGGSSDPKLMQDDSIVLDAGSTANTSGVMSLLSPLLMPFVWLFR